MPSLLAAIASVQPREKAGAHTITRYGFQVHTSILKILDLHQTGSDYRAAFDHFDDLMVFDKAHEPEKVSFFQIKSKSTGTWTLKDLAKKAGSGPPPVTFLGRLHHHMSNFGQMVVNLGFISNLAFRLKLADGTETTDDHHVIHASALAASEIAAMTHAVTNDAASAPAVYGVDRFVFERTPLGLIDQGSFVKGRLVDFMQARAEADNLAVISLYDVLRGSVLTKSGVTQEFSTADEFYDRKTLCRADIEAMLSRAAAGRRFHENWSAIQHDLITAGMSALHVIKLHSSCIRYIRSRSTGELGASSFNAAVRSALSIHRAQVSACSSLREIVERIEEWVPSDYEEREGACYVEAFESVE